MIHLLIEKLYLSYLKSKLVVVHTWRVGYDKVKSLAVKKAPGVEAKVSAIAADAKVIAMPVATKALANPKVGKIKALLLKLKGLTLDDKVGLLAIMIAMVVISGIYHARGHAKVAHPKAVVHVAPSAQVLPVAKLAPVVTVVAVKPIVASNELVRVSELTPEGQVFLAITVPTSAIISATDSGITWHPTPKVTETWHGSYRISK